MPSDQSAADYVECPTCSAQVMIGLGGFIEGRSVTCTNTHAFNVYAVYRDFYQRIPLATGIGQKLKDAVYRSYRVRGLSPDVSTIEAFLNANSFGSMLSDIVLDTVIYGNSVVYTPSSAPPKLRRVDLADAVIQIGRDNGRGEALIPTVQSITDSSGRALGGDFIHFTHSQGSAGPMGSSAFGAWFRHFYLIRDAPQALTNAAIMRNLGIDRLGLTTVSQIREYFADAILTGADLAGYRHSMISDSSQTIQPPVGILLRTALDARRAEIRDRIERDIFPLALGRPWQPRDWPEFEMMGL